MFYSSFRVFRPRHPLARLLVGVLGLVAIALFVVLGMFALGALVVGGAVLMLINAFRNAQRPVGAPRPAPPTAPPIGVIEGEFTVVPSAPGTHARDAR